MRSEKQQGGLQGALCSMERTVLRRWEVRGTKTRGSYPSPLGYHEAPAKRENNR